MMIKGTNKFTKLALFAWLAATAGFSLADDKEAASEPASTAKEAEGNAAAEAEEKAPPTVRGLELLPVGETNRGVRLPLYDKVSGALQFVFNIKELTPVDDERENLDMVNVKIDVLGKDPEGADTMKIDLKTANYNTVRGIISTDEPAVIERADFRLEGETMDFDTRRGLGRMTGKTKMTIFDFQQMTNPGKQTPEGNPTAENKKPPLPRMNIR